MRCSLVDLPVMRYHQSGLTDAPYLVVATLPNQPEIKATLTSDRSKLIDEVTLLHDKAMTIALIKAIWFALLAAVSSGIDLASLDLQHLTRRKSTGQPQMLPRPLRDPAVIVPLLQPALTLPAIAEGAHVTGGV